MYPLPEAELWRAMAPLWNKHRNHPEALEYPRPTLIGSNNCTRVTIKDVMLLNSPSWMVNPICCSNVTIDNISYTGRFTVLYLSYAAAYLYLLFNRFTRNCGPFGP